MNNETQKDSEYSKYMNRISSETFPVYKPDVGKRELELLKEVIDSNWISEGHFVRKFESQLEILSGKKFALCFSNATSAMITGMLSLGIGQGDHVVVPSFSHSADPNSISATGATPIFSDVNYSTMCLSVSEIKKVITDKTRAILYVSAYGNTDDLDDLSLYCKQNNLIFINDCAPALGGTFRHKKISSFGDFSVFSFFADKTITTGEGGVLLTDNSDLINDANIYKHDGRRERGIDKIERRGFNYRITEMQGAMGVAQLERLDYFISRKKEIYEYYRSKLKNNDSVQIFEFNKEGNIVPHRIVLMTPNSKSYIDYLVKNGIGARTLFMPMHQQPVYNEDRIFANSQKLYEYGLELPSYPSLTKEDIDYIVEVINKKNG